MLRPPDAGVHVITPTPSSVDPAKVASRACRFRRYDADIHAYLPFLSERRRGRVGVMLIDVLQATMEQLRPRGLQERYDANPVIDNIAAVLDAASRGAMGSSGQISGSTFQACSASATPW